MFVCLFVLLLALGDLQHLHRQQCNDVDANAASLLEQEPEQCNGKETEPNVYLKRQCWMVSIKRQCRMVR